MNTIKLFFTEYKTSIAGVLGGAMTAYAGGTTLKSCVAGVLISLIGLFAKDATGANK